MWKGPDDCDYPKPVGFAMKTQQIEGHTFAIAIGLWQLRL